MFTRTLVRCLSLTAVSVVTLSGCGGDPSPKKSGARSPSASPSPTTAPPTFSAAALRTKLVTPAEIGSGVKATSTVADFYRNGQIPVCSLESMSPGGTFDALIKQYENGKKGKREVRYAQLVATFPSVPDATAAFGRIEKKLKSCRPKNFVPTKKISQHEIRFSHNDVWQLTEPASTGWRHLRGIETQKYARSISKGNWLRITYDYAIRGNVLLATVYLGRTDPDEQATSIEQHAAQLFDTQIRKIG
ncbi:sensor domain-containing protein [Actinomadura rayongensis]|uniref:Sensor domain-containing protein n=1 Tax=Actinomadura rayongensis TaxID=1429076 RepID=A0A6I4VX96_9ACTN|nr:sensor domain-containing protein [Actinomadura rayongensis]MXQ62979.1 hypothetical protein [Actinomadura rayongensis]